MPHLNQLVEKYAKKGLVVVGVTDEPEGPTQKYLDDTGWKAIVAFEGGLASMNAYGFKGFPSAALVDAKGKVVWKGSPSQLTDSQIEGYLAGAKAPGSGGPDLKLPLSIDGKLSPIAKKSASGAIGGAMTDIDKALAGKVDEGAKTALETAKTEIQALYDEEMKLAQEAFDQKRYFDAKTKWARVEKAFKGHALANDPKEKLGELAADTTLTVEIQAGEQIAKSLELKEKGDVAGAIKGLKRVTTGAWKTTEEAKRAASLIAELESGKKSG